MPKRPPAWQKGRALLLLIGCLAAAFAATGTIARADNSRLDNTRADNGCTPTALGTSRTLALGTKGGFRIGFKSYPQSLDLADHEVVLTFDDGPSPATTPLVLDALRKECVRATFFLIGRNAAAYPALVKRELTAGETIGHHTFSHPARTLRLMNEAAAEADIEKGFAADDTAAYGRFTGTPTVGFFRFPGFADSPALDAWLAAHNVGIFGADLWASDWLPMTPDEELKLVLERLEKDGRGILLLHDTKRSTALMLPKLLSALRQKGFHIVQLVPAEGAPPQFRAAPTGWTSETEEILAKVLGPTHKTGPEKARPAKFDAPKFAHGKPHLPEPGL